VNIPPVPTASTTRTWLGDAADAYEQGRRDGAAAERESIARLARSRGARYPRRCPDAACPHAFHQEPFDTLLGGET
jgi:hypothetical protein